MNLLRALHRDERGQDLLEYSLLALILALGALAGMGTLAKSINAEFTRIASNLT